MNKKMVIEKIPELKDNEVYVSHISDGEYPFNTFGGVYTNLNLFLSCLANYFNCSVESLHFYCLNHINGYYISKRFFSPETADFHYYDIGYITIETINPNKFIVL
jgi:hypothetical protein